MHHRPTVLMYSPDSIGLGHMQRHAAISGRLVRDYNDASALMLVGSGVGAFFDQPQGVDSIKLPSVQKVGVDRWEPRTLGFETGAMRKLRAGLIRETVKVVDPEVFIVDHLVTGVWDELLPTLQMIRSQHRQTKIILGLRDILDAPEHLTRKWSNDGYYDLIDRYYDQIFIYGCPDIFPSAKVYGLEQRFPEKITYCGYVCSTVDNINGAANGEPVSVLDAKSELGIQSSQLIVVTAGGGHDAYPMMSASISALKELGPKSAVPTIMITGPLMPAKQLARLRQESEGVPITIIPWTKKLTTYLAAADLVITMGGYNSMLETVYLGKRTIVIPRKGPSSEQKIRAKLFADLGLVTNVDLNRLTARKLAGEIERSLASAPPLTACLPMTGVDRAAQAIAQHFYQRTPVQRATHHNNEHLIYAINGFYAANG